MYTCLHAITIMHYRIYANKTHDLLYLNGARDDLYQKIAQNLKS